jgi:glycosyltransferase involved in cell wall biosynthesis
MAEVITTAGPKVSIILLLYNGRTHLLKRAVLSVLDQTYKNWELVLQDDCSTDGTFEMAIGFALLNKNIKIFKNKTNLGIVKNRAAAFRNTTGELICHLDNDDFIYAHALEVMVKTFKENPEIGLAYSDTAYIAKNGLPDNYKANKDFGGPLHEYGWRHLSMYKRSAYNQTKGYNEEIEWPCEDGDLFMQIAEKFPFMRVPQVLYGFNNYGDHASSKTPSCKVCTSRNKCNYIRVWAASLDTPINVETWQPIVIQEQLIPIPKGNA